MVRSKENDERLWGSKRLALAIVGFFGFANLYALRVNLSVAIVSMINNTAVDQMHRQETSGAQVNLAPPSHKLINESRQHPSDGDFAWSKDEQGLLLGSFFIGYMFTQIPGGVLAERLGGKNVFLFPMIIAAFLTLLSPLAAKLNVYFFLALRVILGLCEAVGYPAMHSIWSQWAPPLERTKLTSITYSGAQFGNAIAIPIAAFLCDALGWQSSFYAFGVIGLIWCLCWFLMASSSPNECKRISASEQAYVNSRLIGQVNQSKTNEENGFKKPWMEFLKSGPVWAIVVAHTCSNFGTYLVLTCLPTFMSEVLHFDIKSSGLYSSLPYISFWLGILAVGVMADFLITKEILTTTRTRKLFMLISMTGQASGLIGVGFCGKGQEYLAVGLLTFAQGISGLQYGGFLCNHVDIAPRYAGTLYGISNTVATVPGIIAPFFAALLTPDKTILQWREVFMIAGGILIFGSLFYAVFGSGEQQPWSVVYTPEMKGQGQICDEIGDSHGAKIKSVEFGEFQSIQIS